MMLPVRICPTCRYRRCDVAMSHDFAARHWLCGDCPAGRRDEPADAVGRLRAACQHGGQKLVAEMVGVTPGYISGMLCGRWPVTERVLRRLEGVG